MICFSIN